MIMFDVVRVHELHYHFLDFFRSLVPVLVFIALDFSLLLSCVRLSCQLTHIKLPHIIIIIIIISTSLTGSH